MTDIKVFMDYACPFCYIGFAIAEKLKKEEEDINFEFLPYELKPDASEEPSDISSYIPEEVLIKSYERIEGLGKEYNILYNNKRTKFNTHRLLLAGLYAKKEDKEFEFSKQAFKAVFEKGKNVAEAVIVNEIALDAGLNIVEMNNCIESGSLEEEIERAKNLSSVYEVESVPTFIVDDRKKVTDLKPYHEFKKDLLG